MASRPRLQLVLSGGHDREGEIPLSDLAKVAEQTQALVSRLARSLIDRPTLGRLPKKVTEATTLFLVGVYAGSTVLDISGPELDLAGLTAEDMPGELSEIVISTLVDSLETLSDPQPVLPVNVDERARSSLDKWLRSLLGYEQVSVKAELSGGTRLTEIEPRSARDNLHHAESQPALPFVSANHQALTGRLYALNLRTGNFSIEDNAGRSIRLRVPEDLRAEAAQLVDTKVRALGNASLDRYHRLVSFQVDLLEPLPPDPTFNQESFFSRRDILESTPLPGQLERGIIPDLSDDEVNAFLAALQEE